MLENWLRSSRKRSINMVSVSAHADPVGPLTWDAIVSNESASSASNTAFDTRWSTKAGDYPSTLQTKIDEGCCGSWTPLAVAYARHQQADGDEKCCLIAGARFGTGTRPASYDTGNHHSNRSRCSPVDRAELRLIRCMCALLMPPRQRPYLYGFLRYRQLRKQTSISIASVCH